jgi:hypothetical protein
MCQDKIPDCKNKEKEPTNTRRQQFLNFIAKRYMFNH